MGLSPEWKNDLLIAFFVLIFVFFIIFIPKLMKEKGIISKYVARKIIHSFAGLAIFSTLYFTHKFLAVIISMIMALFTKLSRDKSRTKPLKELFFAIGEDEELKYGYLQGPFSYCMAITLLVFIFLWFPDKYYLPITAIVIMMYADSIAGIIGKRYGKHNINIPWVGNKRTIEGSLSFLSFGFAFSLFTLNLIIYLSPNNFDNLTRLNITIISILMSVISTIMELMSPSKYDDLIVPLGCILFIIPILIYLNIW